MNKGLVVFLAVGIASSSFGQAVLTLATGEWAPLTGEALAGGGALTEVVVAAFREADVPVRVEFLPFKRAETLLEQGVVDGIFPFGRNEEREEKFTFGDQLLYSKAKFFYLKGAIKVPEFQAYSDLQSFRIGGLRGSWFEPTFAKAGLSVEYVGTDLQNLQKLVLGRVDIIPMPELVAWDLIAKEFPEYRDKIGTFDFYPRGQAPQDTNTRGVAILFRKSDPNTPALLEKFHRGLSRIQKSGEFRAIFARHFPPEALNDF